MSTDIGKLLQSASEIFLQLAEVYEKDKQENEHLLDLRFSDLEHRQTQKIIDIESRMDHAEAIAAENREGLKATLEAILHRL